MTTLTALLPFSSHPNITLNLQQRTTFQLLSRGLARRDKKKEIYAGLQSQNVSCLKRRAHIKCTAKLHAGDISMRLKATTKFYIPALITPCPD